MTRGKTIKLQSNAISGRTFLTSRKGAVFHLLINGLRWPAELRNKPPRVRLLEDAVVGHTLCELLDPWPDAPEYWPPDSAPKAAPASIQGEP